MKLSDILNSADKPLFSCEFFPPRTDKGEENLWSCLKELQAINPAYISVTYGAGGTTQDRTKGIVSRIKDKTGLSPVAHLTCVGASKTQLGELLAEYKAAGINNILALRGDAPEGMNSFEAVAGGFSYATDLIAFLREQGDFSIACATYPEGHPESKGGVADDIRYLKMKQDNGADCAITQYFFDNDTFFRFRDQCDAAGITLPIIPGIMPVGNFEQIVRFSSMCGAVIPAWLHEKMTPIQHDLDAVKALGIELAAKQCRELLEADAPGLHIYTLNKSEATIAIHQQIKDLL
ncbi:methylenetetrahydrofolate reductase (NADPH) [Mariprofundus micogutta]|uniref:Methylenetetrahydrofolate reductase n=1 Tax=Mariprofundus micogutta TaxID=1921010 RepID=A0A1L8CLZ9_9PROT|nr:methylenetetrahydrofolate reductase [NAD(P)H] [Mariprofundus micogutta]GAV19933.1 methylenetetrahydrofolate reductase (NADPH) [Mariprofundus micogutta]